MKLLVFYEKAGYPPQRCQLVQLDVSLPHNMHAGTACMHAFLFIRALTSPARSAAVHLKLTERSVASSQVTCWHVGMNLVLSAHFFEMHRNPL
jgi:hypothetical protein